MADALNYTGEVPASGSAPGAVTLVQGSTFCISEASGDVYVGGAPQGLFFRDTRILSRLELRVDGRRLEPLGAHVRDPFSGTFVARARPRPGRADSTILAVRHRYVGRGMREDLVIHNFGDEPAALQVDLLVEADFADLFDVKEGRGDDRLPGHVEVRDGRICIEGEHAGRRRAIAVVARGMTAEHQGATAAITIAPQAEWWACIELIPLIEGEEVEPRYRCGQPVEEAAPSERLAQWRERVPVVDADPPDLRRVVARSQEDLGGLRIFDPDHPELPVIAAGAPWFMTLFGRDSLLTSWMSLIIDPDLALGVLQTLARFQGDDVVPETEEEPGRILHEMRFGTAASLSLGGGQVYYGTVDATPLFVMLLGELRRWGLAEVEVSALLPHADRALAWIEEFGDRDGDGFVEYARATPRGLRNQGWKDSFDGVRFADGRLGEGPIALCEVQGYVYAAYVARAHFAAEAGDDAAAERYRVKARELKAAFNQAFWVDEHGWYAMGLDGDKRPLDALASNMGHCLWTGIVDEDRAGIVARQLASDELFNGWGIRTLGASMGGFNPISYHNGSVWPHDTALCVAGMMRYGYVDEALRVIQGLIDAAVAFGGRLPELFGGVDRAELPVPLTYPASCSPQAWASAAPVQLLRTMLRLDPWLPHGKVWLAPVLPPGMRRLRVDRIPLGRGRARVEVEGDTVFVDGLPPGTEWINGPRRPLTAEVPAR